jgi:hypothetical protein
MSSNTIRINYSFSLPKELISLHTTHLQHIYRTPVKTSLEFGIAPIQTIISEEG